MQRGDSVPKRWTHADDEPASRPAHYQHCLYLLAEAERVIDRTAAEWPPAEAALVKSRLLQVAEKLPTAPMPSRKGRVSHA
jgi:hypothetical protein